MMARRVYEIPDELHSRLTVFADKVGYSSEVKAVRFLINWALDHQETSENLIERLKPLNINKVKEIACGHPLVAEMHFDLHSDEVTLNFTDGNGASFGGVL
ncbi:hypothetical protein [Ochrobactrum sp. SFR4]|uniref:hypothetical protein n=1 Tax=Ochrobactrum sp. SFR4 TaxID=2717368 RepID=UPI001C8C28C3|nr:hypothetical protein [Ochrobactrum sp. SFR4]MBX8825280.1 hypothetical protein [Ochrobactrum sp. SFR4]